MLMGGRDRLMTSGEVMFAESVSIEETSVEPSIEQQIVDLQQSITFLEGIWMTDDLIQHEINAEDWQTFMNALYECLNGLQTAIEQ